MANKLQGTELPRAALNQILDAYARKGRRDLDDRTARVIRSQLRRWHLAGEIIGYGVGFKQVKGVPTDQIALQIHVRRKRPRPLLPTPTVIPPVLNWRGFEAPIVLDVIETAPFQLAALDDTERPIFPGLSIGHCITGETGSLGAIVRALDN